MEAYSNRKSSNLHRIVIVGGGAGGLELATRLGNSLGKKRKAEIILIDATLTHIWKPLLHEVASGTLNSYDDELNYFAHANKNNFNFFLGKMVEIDRTQKNIILEEIKSVKNEAIVPRRMVSYDTLVIAIGSTSNDFGTLGAKENCIFLDSRQQADRFQNEFLNLYIQAQANELVESDKSKNKVLNIAIVGAGATGVELAAELHHASHQFCKYGLDSISPENVSITLIEASNRILPGLSEKVSLSAKSELLKMGIKILTNSRVTKIDDSFIYFEDGQQILATLKVWSAGIKAPDFLKNISGLETNRINQLVVRPTLQTTFDDCIFAMGDCASFTPEGYERALPPRAQVANQQAIFLEKALKSRLAESNLPHFTFKDKGSLVSLSQSNSVGYILGSVNIEGLIARMMYISLYRFHQIALHGFFKTSILILKDIISKSSKPHLKMH
ncbi:NAD(P)/FAD-dependent oxidoreductase [Acinetobacter pittii]|uniref:NAD(P)/FAD-dependent oxidoreductase n=1 Tax=Acinetobacter pittii TaxID=48296 RepID=UPI00197D98DF|nr:NAD(P)/FAD-dependent oxidoreductase [Acinetobacter pittii]MBN6492033.1 NAD(P)/FAD-dependent oxidoreductase [Acinetobacter pittii]MDO7426488.1 NAD(P)/FAD-dependent oxidoreductase [Acinetobacter baumannii]